MKTRAQHPRGSCCLEEAEDRYLIVSEDEAPDLISVWSGLSHHQPRGYLLSENKNRLNFAKHPPQLTLHTIMFLASKQDRGLWDKDWSGDR